MKIKFIFVIKIFLVSLIFTFNSFNSLLASQDFTDPHEETLYKRGIDYRNAGKVYQAIDCFLPLAKKDFVRAQHNLAMQYYALGNEMSAYKWFKRASDLSFSPSRKNLRLMNLIDLLLPNEMVSHVTSFLAMQDLCSFSCVSRRAHSIVESRILDTEFLTSLCPYARDVRAIFSKVVFEPHPQSIRVRQSVCTNESDIAVHFRNTQHLRDIVEQTPRIQAKGKVYFVRNEEVEEGKEIIPLDGQLKQSKFIHITSDRPLKLKGELKLSCALVLPRKSDFNDLNFNGKEINTGKLVVYHSAIKLANVIDTFNEELFSIRTSDAASLLKYRLKKRHETPQSFPELIDLCPRAFLLSSSEINISQQDYIEAAKPLIYIADSISALEELRMRLPEFGASIGYIDYQRINSGIYCVGPLSLRKGFNIYSDTHLTMAGEFLLPDYNVTVESKEGIWTFGFSLHAANIGIIAKLNLYIGPLYHYVRNNIKPENMPEEEWVRFLIIAQHTGIMRAD